MNNANTDTDNAAILSFADHYAVARTLALRDGAHDAIHYAPRWNSRADALYAIAQAHRVIPGNPYLLSDGRMVVACDDVWFFESR